MKKNHKIELAVLLSILLLVAVYREVFKITDPSDPRFNPDRFSFGDYNGNDELIPVYRKLFPQGTPKEFVDRVLVKAGRANSLQEPSIPQRWNYGEPRALISWDAPPSDIFIFDKKNRLRNIYIGRLDPPIYPDNTTLEELYKTMRADEK